MKLLIYLFLTALVGFLVHIHLNKKFSKEKNHSTRKPLVITTVVVAILVAFGFCMAYASAFAPDKQCWSYHAAITTPPTSFTTAGDYFNLGNYDYDIGNCVKAVADYTKAIDIQPNFAKAYNNRAYTYMRMQYYKKALSDLDKAIEINPNYVEALMNRGDIYNYYYAIDRKKAILDYNRVIALGVDKDQSKSVCGHKAMAQINNFVPLAIVKVITNTACN